MGRRREVAPAAPVIEADERLARQRVRRVERALGMLTMDGGEFASFRPLVDKMRAATAATDDLAEQLRLVLACADAIRPALVAAIGEERAAYALGSGGAIDWPAWRAELARESRRGQLTRSTTPNPTTRRTPDA